MLLVLEYQCGQSISEKMRLKILLYSQFAVGICGPKLIEDKPVPYLLVQQAICHHVLH